MSRPDALIKSALASLVNKANVSMVFCSRSDYHDVRDHLRRIGVDTTGHIGVLTPKGRVPLRVDTDLEPGEFTARFKFADDYLRESPAEEAV